MLQGLTHMGAWHMPKAPIDRPESSPVVPSRLVTETCSLPLTGKVGACLLHCTRVPLLMKPAAVWDVNNTEWKLAGSLLTSVSCMVHSITREHMDPLLPHRVKTNKETSAPLFSSFLSTCYSEISDHLLPPPEILISTPYRRKIIYRQRGIRGPMKIGYILVFFHFLTLPRMFSYLMGIG